METDFVQLGRGLLVAYARHDYPAVGGLARQYLSAAEHHRHSAYYGTAVHQANTLLGLMELREGRPDRAADYLLASARTPGSPQLTFLGPSMLLAESLLAAGQSSAVIHYLQECRKLWKLSFGTLGKWRRQIARGRVPDFGANLSYLIDYKTFG
ncbi:hypothetical protein GGR26_000834 [Lewinella marina]|uniref:MalT-like TPR region domain-containing protein n=1 Tax=Neolewinella marina TaxID=438751 RepID=A0A2G0CIG5_9BACT|nr:hypothetical protein [Neolewinella marina]NJB85089.1 hypothetical protein [Neolewinella marina]PHK99771.1 hypothetical protein CGL56_01600 [Neolewinella marina]